MNLSLVTFLEYEGCGIVIPGDLECEGWEELLKTSEFCQCLSETTIFIASHHGRNAGYSEKIFDHCKPHIILLSDKTSFMTLKSTITPNTRRVSAGQTAGRGAS